MKVLDRLMGRQVDVLPGSLMPGRYSLLDQLVFNGHELKAGDLLLDDGSGSIRLKELEHAFSYIELSDQDEAKYRLAVEAIITIAGKIANAHDLNISTMLPSEIAAQGKLNQLEKSLKKVLKERHLHSISDQPRMNLRYDDSVTSVARARRLATSALTHLASHSDCWQQRTLSGVLPRKILARFSQDDYAIYENRLYKRLLDKLDRYLSGRINKIQDINVQLENALDFEKPEKTHFRLRRKICQLWGEAYQDDSIGTQLKVGKDTLAELQKQLHAIRGLKQYAQGLYIRIPANAVMPTEIHLTNILNDDAHYCQLPPLWEMLQANKEDQQLTPEERLVQHQKLQSAYSDYVGLVLKRALEVEKYQLSVEEGQIGFIGAGKKFVVKQEQLDWIIVDKCSGSLFLRFIPIAWFGTTLGEDETLDSDRVVCWPGNEASLISSQHLRISPMDLYVVEKMGRLLDEWLLRQLLESYGRQIGPLPTPVKRLTDNWSDKFQSVSPTHVRLVAPLESQQLFELRNELKDSAKSQLIEVIESAIEQIDLLSRQCGHIAEFKPNSNGFYCRCDTCETIWFLRSVGRQKRFSMYPKGGSDIQEDHGFQWAGRDWLDINLDS